MKKYICDACAYLYNPELGDEEHGIAPGTAFEDLPDDYECPLCGVEKKEFSIVKKAKAKKYICDACAYTYNPEIGDEAHGIAPGTAFEDLPDDYECDLCEITREKESIIKL